jgi:8-oxo-dGTP diphosphatase
MARGKLRIGEDEPDVSAAGGVVLRRDGGGPTQVAVIHRPKYMDWSLPKGKLEPGEDWEHAALREVEEETGIRCDAGPELDSISYLDRKARRKLVRYWLMEPIEGEFEPHGEVDELRWVTRPEAEELLTYDHDRALVRKAMRRQWLRRLLRLGSGR